MGKDVLSSAAFEITLQVEGTQYPFAKFSGGKRAREATEYPIPNKYKQDSILGSSKYDDITLETPYIPDEHDKLDEALSKSCGGEKMMVQVTPVKICPNAEKDGRSRVYRNLKASEQMPPEADQGSSSPAVYSCTFTVGEMIYQ